MIKKDFRKNVLNIRKNKSESFISIKSKLILEKLLSMNCIKDSQNIMLYLDFNNEVKTDNLVNSLINLNKVVSSPITIVDSKELTPYRITNLNNLCVGAYGIREPNENTSIKIDLTDIDVVIVPAVAYDKNCYRLGYGGGYYDRFLSKLRMDAVLIGLAFDFQVFDSIPKEDHDVQLDYVVTESTILYSSKNNL